MDAAKPQSPDSTPRILAIETSGTVGSIAVAEGSHLLAEARLAGTSRHAADLFPAIDRLWRQQGWQPADMRQVYISIGPGSFTGLRIAVTVARHLALAVNARIIGVPSLDVIAEASHPGIADGAYLAVMLNARQDMVFGAIYRREADRMTPLREATMLSPTDLLQQAPRPCHVTGEGVKTHLAAIETAGGPIVPEEMRWPQARDVHRLGWQRALRGEFTLPQDLVPLYIRRPEAEEVWNRRAAENNPPTPRNS